MGQMMGGGGTSGGGDPFAADPFATAGGFAGGGGGGGGSGDTGATSYADPNAYDYSGGNQGGAPNDYAYQGGGATGPWGDQGGYQNPTPTQSLQQSEQMGTAGSPPPPPQTTAQGGQQSGSPSQPSWVQSVSDLLLGKSGDAAGKMQAEATGGGGLPSTSEAKGPGWFASPDKPLPQLPTTTAAEYGAAQNPAAQNPANAAVSAPPGAATASAATPPAATPPAAPVPTPRPRPAEAPQAPAAAPGAADAATVSPQSSPDFGKKSANQAAAETAPGTDTAGTASTYPDIAGSAREAGMGPPATAGQGMPQGIGGKGNALGDLLTLNFGRFLGDLFGGQGAPGTGGLPSAGPARTAETPARTAETPARTAETPARTAETAGNPPQVPNTPTGVPGQPSINRAYPQVADVGQALKPQAPGSAAASTTPEPVGTPGTMTVTPMGQAGMPQDMRQAIAKPQVNPDGSATPTNGMPGGITTNAPLPSPGLGASPDQGNRPRFYRSKLTINGKQFDFGSGGGQFASLPYGTYQLHPGAIGSIGQRIGAIAGISDSNNPGNNTVHDPLYTGGGGTHARDGVEIHPDVSGGRMITNGCIGVNRSQWGAFSREFRDAAARGPLTLTVGPNGATIQAANAPRPPADIPTGGVASLPHERYARTVTQIESGGNPNARMGSNRGLGQFGPAEERRYGITAANRNDPAVQQRAIAQEGQENSQHLQRSGVPATPENLYILHQQGRSGGTALLTANPSTPAWQSIRRYYGSDAIAKRAITGNIPGNNPLRNVPVNQITAGQFREMWQQRYAAMSGQPAVPAAAQNPANAAVASRPPPGAAAAGTAEQGARVFGFTPGQGARLEPGDRVRTTPRRWDPNDPMNTPFRHHGGGSRG